jgi:hypothetical protein
MRLTVLLALAALALAGCNANQAPNAAAETRFSAGSANDFNPIKYAQTSGFYAGR